MVVVGAWLGVSAPGGRHQLQHTLDEAGDSTPDSATDGLVDGADNEELLDKDDENGHVVVELVAVQIEEVHQQVAEIRTQDRCTQSALGSRSVVGRV